MPTASALSIVRDPTRDAIPKRACGTTKTAADHHAAKHSGDSPIDGDEQRTSARGPADKLRVVPLSKTDGWVCLQLEDANRTRATQQLVAIVGAVEYAICVRCGQEAPDGKDEAYLPRARRYLGALES